MVKNSHTEDMTLGEGKEYLLFAAGDSVGAGVGASTFETSVVGRVAEYLSRNRSVKLTNKSVSGYKMHDILKITPPSKKHDLILLIVSSNNLFRFTNLTDFKKDTEEVFKRYAPKADKIIIIGPGRIFDAGAIPLMLKPLYGFMGWKYAGIMRTESLKYKNIIYINPFETKMMKDNYQDTSASDHFHPNDEGHRFWFDLIKKHL